MQSPGKYLAKRFEWHSYQILSLGLLVRIIFFMNRLDSRETNKPWASLLKSNWDSSKDL